MKKTHVKELETPKDPIKLLRLKRDIRQLAKKYLYTWPAEGVEPSLKFFKDFCQKHEIPFKETDLDGMKRVEVSIDTERRYYCVYLSKLDGWHVSAAFYIL